MKTDISVVLIHLVAPIRAQKQKEFILHRVCSVFRCEKRTVKYVSYFRRNCVIVSVMRLYLMWVYMCVSVELFGHSDVGAPKQCREETGTGRPILQKRHIAHETSFDVA